MDDRLSKHDMTPEGGCSASFRKMLSDFLYKRVATLCNIRRALQLDEFHVQKKDSSILESVAANISGISAKQLQVCVVFLFWIIIFHLCRRSGIWSS